MNLFVVNRYEDEEWKKVVDTSQNHLSDLLQRIEERKRERQIIKEKEKSIYNTVEDSKVENYPKETINQVQKKKSKKRKGLKRELDTSFNEVAINVSDEETVDANLSKYTSDLNQTSQAFTILGNKGRVKTQTAKRVLPYWLTHPEIVSSDLSSGSTLEEMQTILDTRLIDKLKSHGFTKLFPIQSQVLSWLLQCNKDYKTGKWVRDTCVCMPTGSGKTLAYTLPIIQLLKNCFVRLVRCLIVLPVQELASQVYEVLSKYSAGTSLRVTLITGASSFKEEQERLIQKTERGDFISKVDIVIATPGRLVDHIKKTSGFSLSYLRFLVIDEADRATDWLQYIPFQHAKPPPLSIKNIRCSWNMPAQKILLSATLSQDPEKLSRLGLFRPILFTSAVVDLEKLDKDMNLDEDTNISKSRYGNPSELTEKIIECTLQYKPLVVYRLLTKQDNVEKTLIFTNSSEAAHRLAILLQSMLKKKEVTVGELSAQLGSKQREETLEKFLKGTFRVLVSSDALARGLDIPGIKLVVSYDLPKYIKGYIHRAGRTGRGGNTGMAVSLLLSNQMAIFKKMLSKVGRSIPEIEKESFEDLAESIDYQNHLEILQTMIINEHEQNNRKQKIHKRVKKK